MTAVEYLNIDDVLCLAERSTCDLMDGVGRSELGWRADVSLTHLVTGEPQVDRTYVLRLAA